VILSDTVGFVSDLPHELVAAFRATLEEVLEADVIVHVRDVAHPDSQAQRSDVEGVLRELGIGDVVDRGLIEALNKVDLLAASQAEELVNQTERNPRAVALSAITGKGLAAFLALLDKTLSFERQVLSLDIPLADGAAIAWLYQHGEVVHRDDDDASAHMTVRLDPADAASFERRT